MGSIIQHLRRPDGDPGFIKIEAQSLAPDGNMLRIHSMVPEVIQCCSTERVVGKFRDISRVDPESGKGYSHDRFIPAVEGIE